MKVLVTGATGFLGASIVQALRARGDHVIAFSRDAARAKAQLGAEVECVSADLETAGAWRSSIAGTDAIIHLAGEPLAGKKWDARKKQAIRDSRVEGTRGLVEAIAAAPADVRPRVLVSASGTDYYPYVDAPHGFDDDDVTEADPPSDDFLGRLCRDWEEEATLAEPHGVRVVRMRTGLVLGRGGGALAAMTGPFKFFVGGRIGNGRQWVSWIQRDDVIAAYLAALSDPRFTGPVNLVADSSRASDLAKAIGAALHRPSWLPVPAFAVRAAAGELAQYLLHGRRVVPKALRDLGFRFAHPSLREAVAASL